MGCVFLIASGSCPFDGFKNCVAVCEFYYLSFNLLASNLGLHLG